MKPHLFLYACCLGVLAQEPIAPTPGGVGPGPGQNVGEYNIVQSWELGYRFHSIGGNADSYRSMVNYGNGVRLLGSSLTLHSRDGRGHWFDEIVLSSQGLGDDPYQSVVFRARKNRIFDYNVSWRLNKYYNPNLIVSNGEHFRDTERRWQDHDLTLFPQSHFRVRAAYGRNLEDGPSLTTEQIAEGNAAPALLFANLRREFNSYSVGGDLELSNIKLTVQRRWDAYKEDTGYRLNVDNLFGQTNPSSATSLDQSQPYHGSTPTWLGNVFTEQGVLRINGRATYSGGRRNSILNERFFGGLPGPANRLNEVVVFGSARRPVLTADFGITGFVTKKLTLIESSSYSDIRIDGDATFAQYSNSIQVLNRANFQFLGLRRFATALDARYAFFPKLSAFVSYQYSSRLIRSVQNVGSAPASFGIRMLNRQTNHLNAAVLGINWSPWKPLQVNLQGELGRNANPFTPVSERNYHAVDARVRYTLRKIRWTAMYTESYNNNSIAVTAYSSRGRTYSANATWTGYSWMSVDTGYSNIRLRTAGGIAFFAGTARPALVQGTASVFVSNIHSANLGMRFNLKQRVELYLGESITHDSGDGRAANTGPANSVAALLYSVQTFPLNFHSPSARLTVTLAEKLRFNAGFQYYGYREEFGLLGANQNYRANTGFAGVTFSF